MCPVKSVTNVIGLDQPKIYEEAPRTRLRGELRGDANCKIFTIKNIIYIGMFEPK
jgi:hypothetical protein